MALPVHIGEQTKLTIELLKYCQSLFKRIKYVLFDRGFYIVEVIYYFTANKINYQMLVPKFQEKITNYIYNTKKLETFIRQLKHSKDKSTWRPQTKLVICKNMFGYDWIFATNLIFKTGKTYVLNYKKKMAD